MSQSPRMLISVEPGGRGLPEVTRTLTPHAIDPCWSIGSHTPGGSADRLEMTLFGPVLAPASWVQPALMSHVEIPVVLVPDRAGPNGPTRIRAAHRRTSPKDVLPQEPPTGRGGPRERLQPRTARNSRLRASDTRCRRDRGRRRPANRAAHPAIEKEPLYHRGHGPCEELIGAALDSFRRSRRVRRSEPTRSGTEMAKSVAPGRLEIDLGDVTFIDSSGLGALISLRNAARESGANLVLVRMSPAVARFFELAGVSDSFKFE